MTWQEKRDRVLLGFAILGLTAELVVWVVQRRQPDPSLTVGLFGLLGVPYVLKRDEQR